MLSLILSFVACTGKEPEDPTSPEPDADTDTDADSDADTDSDTDADSDTDVVYTLDWIACDDGFECATLHRDGDEIAVQRHVGTGTSGRVAVVGQGGPGASSIGLLHTLVTYWGPYDPELWLDVTWVAMDNRGVGRTDPIQCVDDAWFDDLRTREPVPTDNGAGLLDSSTTFRDGCAADDLDRLDTLGTPTVAADLDAVRSALGVETLDFIGFSYGTWLGTVYAATYPDRVGRFVIDGVVAPSPSRDAFLADQAEGFSDAMGRFYDRCDADPACTVDDPQTVYRRLRDASVDAPLPAPSDPLGRSLSHNDLRWAITSLLYGPDDAFLADALAAAEAGDAALLLEAADDGWGFDPYSETYGLTYQAYWAIGCLDLPWPAGWTEDDVWAFGASLDQAFPDVGSSLLTGELNCLRWPVEAPLPSLAAPIAPPLLVVNGLHDPATPMSGAEAIVGLLDNDSFLLSFGGDGHVAFFSDGSGCVYNEIRTFLLDGTEPSVDLCP